MQIVRPTRIRVSPTRVLDDGIDQGGQGHEREFAPHRRRQPTWRHRLDHTDRVGGTRVVMVQAVGSTDRRRSAARRDPPPSGRPRHACRRRTEQYLGIQVSLPIGGAHHDARNATRPVPHRRHAGPARHRRRPPVFSSTGLWSPGSNLTGFESAFGHKPPGSVRPGISWVALRCIPFSRLRRLRGHAPCW